MVADWLPKTQVLYQSLRLKPNVQVSLAFSPSCFSRRACWRSLTACVRADRFSSYEPVQKLARQLSDERDATRKTCRVSAYMLARFPQQWDTTRPGDRVYQALPLNVPLHLNWLGIIQFVGDGNTTRAHWNDVFSLRLNAQSDTVKIEW